MNNKNLPTDELKKFGVMNDDLSFSDKLDEKDIQKFLNGYTIVADNDIRRATYQLTDNNTRLKVIFLERDKGLAEILKNGQNTIEYSNVNSLSKRGQRKFFERKAFVPDKAYQRVVEFDLIKNAGELTEIILATKNVKEISKYKNELVSFKVFLQETIDLSPKYSDQLNCDLNVILNEIAFVEKIMKSVSEGLENDDVVFLVDGLTDSPNTSQERQNIEDIKIDNEQAKNFKR